MAYDSAIVTKEETPGTLTSLLKQRTRWNQGFLQVYRKGEWRRLPEFGQRMLARYTLTQPFLQAFSGIVIPIGIAIAIWAQLPVFVALITFVPVIPMAANLVFQTVGLRDFGLQYGLRTRWHHYARLILGAFPYALVLAVAALRAVWREYTGKRNWELTAHTGAHLTDQPVKAESGVAA